MITGCDQLSASKDGEGKKKSAKKQCEEKQEHTLTKTNTTAPFLSVCNTISLFSLPSGNTYDRSIVVDEEEASILLYDIWEQVSYILLMFCPFASIRRYRIKMGSAV